MTYFWTIYLWATRENEQRSDDLLETWEEPAPIPTSSASPLFRKCVVRPSLRPVIANPWCFWKLSPTSVLLERGRREPFINIGSVILIVYTEVRTLLQILQISWLRVARLPKRPSRECGKHVATMAEQFSQLDQDVTHYGISFQLNTP